MAGAWAGQPGHEPVTWELGNQGLGKGQRKLLGRALFHVQQRSLRIWGGELFSVLEDSCQEGRLELWQPSQTI